MVWCSLRCSEGARIITSREVSMAKSHFKKNFKKLRPKGSQGSTTVDKILSMLS